MTGPNYKRTPTASSTPIASTTVATIQSELDRLGWPEDRQIGFLRRVFRKSAVMRLTVAEGSQLLGFLVTIPMALPVVEAEGRRRCPTTKCLAAED